MLVWARLPEPQSWGIGPLLQVFLCALCSSVSIVLLEVIVFISSLPCLYIRVCSCARKSVTFSNSTATVPVAVKMVVIFILSAVEFRSR